MINNNVNGRFRELLSAMNLTVADLVRDIGGTTSKYYKVVKDDVKPNFETLFGLIKAYPEVNGDWLLTGRGSMIKGADKETEMLKNKVETLENVLMKAMGKFEASKLLPVGILADTLFGMSLSPTLGHGVVQKMA